MPILPTRSPLCCSMLLCRKVIRRNPGNPGNPGNFAHRSDLVFYESRCGGSGGFSGRFGA